MADVNLPNPPTIPNIPNPLPPQVNQTVQSAETNVKKRLPDFMKKKPFIISVVLVVILLVSMLVISMNHKPVSNVPGSQDTLLATVGGVKIFKSDVQREAEQQYSANAVDTKVLTLYLNKMIENYILEIEASKANITVEATESAALAKTYVGSSSAEISPILLNKAKLEILKSKIMRQYVSSRLASTVNFWTPGSSYPQSELDETQKKDAQEAQSEAKIALPQITTLIKNGIDPLVATKTIMKNSQFATLAKIIAVNGYIVSKASEQYLLTQPKLYTSTNQTALGKVFFDSLFSMKSGEVKSVFSEDGSAGFIFKVLEAKDSQYKTYNDWAQARKKELVVINNPL